MRQHLGARRGNYMMTMPFFLPALIGFAALSIDISYINMAQSQVQHVADAASHAAFVGYRATNGSVAQKVSVGTAAATYIVNNNQVGGANSLAGCTASGNGSCDSSEFARLTSVEYGEWDFTKFGELGFDSNSNYVNSARARVSRHKDDNNPLDLFFAPILGLNTANVVGRGVTAGRTRQIMIVQDVSCSFDGDDIANARDADLAFLEYMNANSYPGDMLGMTLFAGIPWYPKMYELNLVEDHYDAMKTNFETLDICYNLPVEFQAFPKKNRCWTSQARGLIQARDQLMNADQGGRGDSREFQAVIMVSDGEPTADLLAFQDGYKDAAHDDEGTEWHRHTGDAETQAGRAADQLWGSNKDGDDMRHWEYSVFGCQSQNAPGGSGPAVTDIDDPICGNYDYVTDFDGGVHMWSVYFNKNGNQTSQDLMEDLFVKGYGRAYATTDSNELSQIMVEIASSIPVVLTD